jgi:hypothetical protein
VSGWSVASAGTGANGGCDASISGEAAGAHSPAGGAIPAASRTSVLVIRPRGPEPTSVWSGMSCAAAMRRASGVAAAPLAEADDGVSGAAVTAVTTGSAGLRSPLPVMPSPAPATPIRAISAPTFTVLPSGARIESWPSASASSVTVALSVSTSRSSSPLVTQSPPLTSQLMIVPCSMLSVRAGIVISVM